MPLQGDRSGPSATRFRRFGWADLAVVPLVAFLSVPPLVWFGYEWLVTQDAGRYLLGGWHLISGRGYTLIGGTPEIKRGPVFPGLLGLLMALFGRNTESLAWCVRLLALVNPLLAYYLVKRIHTTVAGLIAAVLVTLLSYTATNPEALNIDSVLLTLNLLTLLTLMAAIERSTYSLALLSGLLLGASIVTKETAFVNLPLALLAVLFLKWDLRGALWHYLGVALICIPWWVWVWAVSEQVYLVGRLPGGGLQILAVVAALVFAGLLAVAYLSGMVDRFLANERWRKRTGWLLMLAWVVALTGLLLSTGGAALSNVTFDALNVYVTERLAPKIAVWPLLLAAGGYAVWRTVRGGPSWRLFAMALLFQFPICLLVTIEGWHPRQFLTPQTLLLCALAALTADAVALLASAIREREYSGWPKLIVAVSLIAYLAVSAGVGTWNMLFKHATELSEGGRAASQALEMTDWIGDNVPKGETLVAAPLYTNYLSFLDGDQHTLTRLRLDQRQFVNPTKSNKHTHKKNTVYRTPPNTVWLSVGGGHVTCGAATISVPNVASQMRRQDTSYLMMAAYPTYPGLLSSSSGLEDSGAFEIVHQEGKVAQDDGFALLESTGQSPKAAPVWMGADSVLDLRDCMRTRAGPNYTNRIRSKFPQGIVLVPRSNPDQANDDPLARRDAQARRVIEDVYSGSDSAKGLGVGIATSGDLK
jgi:4-amino-4-deoxy-L-arabinose transferase-like glycosyltransferase